MPAKLERCVESVMSQGKSKESAYAICNASMDALHDGMTHDAPFTFKATIDEVTGFLKAPVTLARVGVQHYMGYELGLADRALDKIGVYRPNDEVFDPASIESFGNMVITDDHPMVAVSVDNVKELQKGQVSDIKVSSSGAVVTGMATITDKDLIKKIQDGKVEVSVGYSHGLREEVGDYQGVPYEFVQTNIRGNHLAVVDAGRCGAACKLTIDHKEERPMIITLDGRKYDVADEQLAQAILNMQASHDAQIKSKDEEMSELEKEKEEAMKEKDQAEAAKDAMSKDIMSADAINDLVSKRAKLISNVTAILGDKAPDCDCPRKAMAAVVDHVLPGMELDGKSDDYVEAAYDMALAKAKKAKESMDKLQGDGKKFVDDKGEEITRDSARNKYMASMGLTV